MHTSTRLIFLVRHGQTDWNFQGRWQGQIGPGINNKGIEQIHLAAEKLRNYNIDSIVSSDTLRAKESALILGELLGVRSIFYSDGLRERMMGNLAGRTESEILNGHPQIRLTKGLLGDNDIEGSEPWKEFVHRSTATFREVAGKYRRNVVIVTHGGVIDQIISLITGNRSYPVPTNGNISMIEEENFSGSMKLVNFSL